MKREGKHILDTVEKYAKPPFDYLTDDMTVPFALALAEKDREILRLRAALKVIADEQNYNRFTVTPETAFEDFGKLNRKVCAIYDVARNALHPNHQQSTPQEKP